MKAEEGNKLIAEFMGANLDENYARWNRDGAYWGYHLFDLKYHTSWDWLMPVWVKIEKTMTAYYIERVPTFGGPFDHEFIEGFMKDEEDVQDAILSGDISKAHEAICSMIVKYGK